MTVLSPSWPFAALAIVAALIVPMVGGSAARAQAQGQPTAIATQHDPVSAAVAEASRRFGVPETWIRSVMRVESAGNAAAVSHAGAMGLMQVMPGTYAELRTRYGLGTNPFDLRDNVLAGTAYLREMFDRYGAPGFLAAYNAGPGRWEAYVIGGRPLPAETVAYLARLGPMIGIDTVTEPSIGAPRAVRSPFAAPIFVALQGTSDGESAGVSVEQIRQVVATNVVVAPSSGELFVRRQSAPGQPAEAPPKSATDAVQPSAREVRPLPTNSPQSALNSLFPPRSAEQNRR